jgi:hypothetical protein
VLQFAISGPTVPVISRTMISFFIDGNGSGSLRSRSRSRFRDRHHELQRHYYGRPFYLSEQPKLLAFSQREFDVRYWH